VTIDDRLTTLDALWSFWTEHGQALTEEQWRQPTRLGAWDARSLYAHAASWPSILSALTDRIRDAEPVVATAESHLVADRSGRIAVTVTPCSRSRATDRYPTSVACRRYRAVRYGDGGRRTGLRRGSPSQLTTMSLK
jgi:hypothetical protein